MTQYIIVLPFDTDEPEFARGVEVGVIWTLLQSGAPIDETVHWSNAEMIVRMADLFARRAVMTGDDETWAHLVIA